MAALLVFGCGAVLLLTGTTVGPPAFPRALAETAHLLSAAAAAVLLALPWTLLNRSVWAYGLALRTLALAVVLALLRGPDWVGAGVALAGGALLAAAAPLFQQGEVPRNPLPPPWLGAAAAVVACAAWLAWHGDPQSLRLLSDESGARGMRAALMAAIALAAAAWTAQPLYPQNK